MSSDEDIPSLGGGRTVWVSSGDHWVFYRELSQEAFFYMVSTMSMIATGHQCIAALQLLTILIP